MSESKIYDSLILGAGPAGLSTALGLGRVHRTCVVFSNSTFRNAGIHAAHAILGHDGKSPEEIRTAGRMEVERYKHAQFVETTIEQIRKESWDGDLHESFVLQDDKGREWRGRTVVIASGCQDIFPDLTGFTENWPSNIYQCLFCDGHERHHMPKGILCSPSLTINDIKMATMAHFQSLVPGLSSDHELTYPPPPSSLTVFTNGPANPNNDEKLAEGLETMAAHGIKLDERSILKLVPDSNEGLHLHFADSEPVHLGFVVHKPPSGPSPSTQAIIAQLGLNTTTTPFGTCISTTPPFNATNIPGVFAAGDVGSPIAHVTNAMFTGVTAAAGVAHWCNERDDERAVRVWREGKGEGDVVFRGCILTDEWEEF